MTFNRTMLGEAEGVDLALVLVKLLDGCTFAATVCMGGASINQKCRGPSMNLPVHRSNTTDSRDPEDRTVDKRDPSQVREKMLDKTIADSFPASDPPSSDPAPAVDPFAA